MTDRYDWETDTLTLFDFQRKTVQKAEAMAHLKMPRLALYYKTGSGKTLTALASLRAMGRDTALVIAPPTTRGHWHGTAEALGMTVTVMSHAKFRRKETKLSRTEPLIVDEFHMLGGYKAAGFTKLERLTQSLHAPLIIASATPNYNDVERCYCIQRVVDPRNTAGGYLTFIYRHCNTEVNPFGRIPKVIEFQHYPDAATFLADLPNVEYIEDDLVYDIEDVEMDLEVPAALLTYGVDARAQRIVGSQIEEKHRLVEHKLIDDDGLLAPAVAEWLGDLVLTAGTPTLVFATHTNVVSAAVRSLLDMGITAVGVTGKTSLPMKTEAINAFKACQVQALVGTVTLATGTDGLDKMCDLLVILDDTEDNAMRRQLVGRIMPRGHAAAPTHSNRVVRLLSEPTAGP